MQLRGTVRFPVRSTEFLQQQLKEMLLRVDGRSGVDTILQMTEIHRGEAKHVQINPWALRDDRLTLDVGERQRILAIALNSASAT